MALALVITTAISFLNITKKEENKCQWVGTEGNVALQNVRLISAAPMRSRSPRWLGKSISTMPVDAAIMPNANLIYDITRKVQVDHTFCAADLQSISASNTE
ncbi:hypothetical protein ACJX0J_038613 [Zea mays]